MSTAESETKYHRVSLSLSEARRRWPDRWTLVNARQAAADGWEVGPRHEGSPVIKTVICAGDSCGLCAGTLAADSVA